MKLEESNCNSTLMQRSVLAEHVVEFTRPSYYCPRTRTRMTELKLASSKRPYWAHGELVKRPLCGLVR